MQLGAEFQEVVPSMTQSGMEGLTLSSRLEEIVLSTSRRWLFLLLVVAGIHSHAIHPLQRVGVTVALWLLILLVDSPSSTRQLIFYLKRSLGLFHTSLVVKCLKI